MFEERSSHVDKAMDALNSENYKKAEREFERALKSLRKNPGSFEYHFALGRLGYTYEQLGEQEKATAAYRESVNAGGDIPATYNGLITLLVSMGELDEAFEVADLWELQGGRHIGYPAHEIFLTIASSLTARREFEEAIQILERSQDYFTKEKHPKNHWTARGLIGFAYEKSGDIDHAVENYHKAIAEGSDHRQTFTRYIMYLEKNKRYDEALQIIQRGLEVQDEASWKADLLKRQQRINMKAGKITKEEAAAIIPQFSVLKGESKIALIHQITCTPQIAQMALIDDRAYGISGGKNPRIRAWSLDSAEHVFELEIPKVATKIKKTDIGFITTSEEGRVGDGSSEVRFYETNGAEVGIQQLEDKTSEIAISGSHVYVGCRDGKLYAFSSRGKKLWNYGLKSGGGDTDYMKPCPYYVRSGGETVVFSSFHELYALNEKGKLRWKWKTPEHKETSRAEGFEFTISTGSPSVTGLDITDDGSRIFVTAGDTIYHLVDGKVKAKKRRKDKWLGFVFSNPDGSLVAVDEEVDILLYEGIKSVGKIKSARGSYLKHGPVLVTWSGKDLIFATREGKDIARLEFVRNIRSADFVGQNRLAVCAGCLVILEVSGGPQEDRKSIEIARSVSFQAEVPPPQPDITEEGGISVRWIYGERNYSRPGKAKYVGKNGSDLTIEQLALEHYISLGCEGVWSENHYWWAIMALLFWDALFAKIPGVYQEIFEFPSPMQDMPRDLFSEEFYPRRKDLIDRRMLSLEGERRLGFTKSKIASEIRNSYKAHMDKPCRIMEWDKTRDPKDLEFAGEVLTKSELEGIMIRLLSDFNHHRRGMPDLFLQCDKKPLFVEVKGEKEKVTPKQHAWLSYLMGLGIKVEICRVTSNIRKDKY